MRLIRLLLDPDPGTGNANPTLASLLSNEPTEGLEPDGITLKPGYERHAISGIVQKDPNYKEPNPGTKPPVPAAPVKPPATAGQEEGLNKDGTLQEGYIREAGTDKIIKDPAFKEAPVETGLNDDGTLKPGFKKDETGKVVEDPDYVPEDEEDETGEKFIAAVDAITGRKYDIKYPDGVAANTPEGMAIRENIIRESAEADFESYLEKNDPRAYAYMLHRAAGGKDEDFFGDQKGFQLPDLTAMKASADIQAQVYKQDLIIKGLDASMAQILVDAAIKDNTLGAKADLSYNLLDKAQKDQLKMLQDKQNADDKTFKDNLTVFTNSVIEGIKNEMGFIVPETSQPEFQKFILSQIRYEEGKFFFVQPILKDNLKTTLESLFFQFKKGDLNTIITKKVKTQAAHRLRLKLNDGNPKPGTGGNGVKPHGDNLPLSAILPTS